MNTNGYSANTSNSGSQYVLGISGDSTNKDWSNYTLPLNRNSKEVLDLEQAGYKVIFPAELSKEAIDKMDDEQKKSYAITNRQALVIDPKEKCSSLDMARTIASHYYSNCPGTITGIDKEKNTLVLFPCGDFPAHVHQSLNQTLTSLGYNSSLDGYNINVSSEVPYPCVEKSKLEQIYYSAKDKIHSVVKNMGLGKKTKEDKQQNNDSMSI